MLKVNVGDALLGAKLADDRSNSGIVSVLHTREQVVLNLVVQTSIHKAQESTANIGRRDNLLVQE